MANVLTQADDPGFNAGTMLLCAWCGPVATAIWIVGFVGLAQFVPPPLPSATDLEIQEMYRSNATMILAGQALTVLGAALIAPFMAAIAVQMKRIEGHFSPLTYTQVGLGVVMVLAFVVPCFMFAAAAFRPERDADLIRMFNDAGWLIFIGEVQTTVIQLLVIAKCIFQDRQQRVFPRWLGYFNLWVTLLLLPGGMCLFFKVGPFAWNGLLAFWLVFTVFCVWFFVMFFSLRKSILRQDAVGTA